MGLLALIAPLVLVPLMLIGSWLGATHVPQAFFPSSPTQFKFKSKDESEAGLDDAKTETLTIQSLLETRVPSLFRGYAPSWWLPNGHLQTGYVVAGDFTKVDAVTYERTLINVPDGGTLAVDMAPPSSKSADLPANTPIVVIQHGLTGGSYESYVRSIVAGVCAPMSQGGLGLRAFVVNFRGCANVPFTSPMIYSAQNTDDLRSGLLYITSKFPDAPLLGIGFSLGANIMTRYLGEEGSRSKLRAGIALACPWDMMKNSDRLESHFIGRHIYSKAMGGNLLAMFKAHIEEFNALPEDEIMTPLIPRALALKNPTLKEIDQHIIRLVGGRTPPFPFESADAYYVSSSSHRSLTNIRVPFLAINAADDPIVGFTPQEETEKSTTCALVVTKHGGHLGWFQGAQPIGRGPQPDKWVRQPALEFLRACAEDYLPGAEYVPLVHGEDRVESDGFVKEKGKSNVGFKVIEDGIVFDGAQSSRNKIAGL